MKYLLIGVNAKYSHSNLAIRSLLRNCNSKDVDIAEYTINDHKENVVADIFEKGADVLCFSCYIWNIEYVKDIVSVIRTVMPDGIIIAGGPEVSYDAREFLSQNTAFDAVMRGEGERVFAQIVQNNACFNDIANVVYKSAGVIIENRTDNSLSDFNELIFPYTKDDVQGLKNKIVYYESSRGCPYNCSYCLSSTIKGVRFRDIATVKKELDFFIDNNVELVKFVDRTFNADKRRALEIWKYASERAVNTRFHFEIAADILTDEMFDFLKTVPEGLFQFEIGIQSVNPDTLAAVDRYNNLDDILKNVKRLVDMGNIHIHTDLIAGLPYEDLASFKHSFNRVYELRSHMLQLGFLKLLKGSKIRAEEAEHGYKYHNKATYEVLENKYISYKDILLLKGIESMTESFYNSGAFKRSLEIAVGAFESPFDFFEQLWYFYKLNGYNKRPVSKRELYYVLYDFCKNNNVSEKVYDNIKFDFIKNNRGAVFLKAGLASADKEFLKWRHSFLTEENIEKYMPQYAGWHAQDILKHIHFERFKSGVCENDGECVVIFDYLHSKEIILNVQTG